MLLLDFGTGVSRASGLLDECSRIYMPVSYTHLDVYKRQHYDSEKKNCAVYKVSDYTEDLAKAHGIHQETEETFTLDSIRELAAKYEAPQALSLIHI